MFRYELVLTCYRASRKRTLSLILFLTWTSSSEMFLVCGQRGI